MGGKVRNWKKEETDTIQKKEDMKIEWAEMRINKTSTEK